VKVCKFGGTSLASAERIQQVCSIIEADSDRRIVVVSAPGKRDGKDTKVTDLLIAIAKAALEGGDVASAVQTVVDRFAEIQRELGIDAWIVDHIAKDLKARASADRSDPGRFTDTLKAAGEDISAKIVAAAFCKRGVEAEYVSPVEAGMVLSDEFGNAQVLEESYTNLASLRDRKSLVIFPGFFGATPSGAIATFPRGGSDITGAILAAAVKADLYENFTDVDSVFAADPRVVDNPRAIHEVTYREMRELSYAGFAVFHDEAVFPAVRARVPICIKNTMNPSAPGTKIVFERDHVPGEAIGIAAADGFCSLYVEKYLMNREIGFAHRLLGILSEEKVPFEHTPSSIDSMSVILNESKFTAEVEKRAIARIMDELHPDEVAVDHGLGLIMIVGEGMRYMVGVAAQATRALADAGVNIEMINQGSSEISIMFGIKSVDRSKAMRALYKAFFAE
jgi:aspartate kinase